VKVFSHHEHTFGFYQMRDEEDAEQGVQLAELDITKAAGDMFNVNDVVDDLHHTRLHVSASLKGSSGGSIFGSIVGETPRSRNGPAVEMKEFGGDGHPHLGADYESWSIAVATEGATELQKMDSVGSVDSWVDIEEIAYIGEASKQRQPQAIPEPSPGSESIDIPHNTAVLADGDLGHETRGRSESRLNLPSDTIDELVSSPIGAF